MKLLQKVRNRMYGLWLGLKSTYAKLFMKCPKVLSVDETLDLLVNKHYSISRNGDGEFNIMMGRDIPFQKSDSKLASILREAHIAEFPQYISAIPNIFKGELDLNEKAKVYFKHFLHDNRYDWYKLAKASLYADTNVTRFYLSHTDKSKSKWQIERLKNIWLRQDVVLVEGKESRLGVNNDLFEGAKSLKRILGPAENAFDVYDELMSFINKEVSKECLILLALGPTATAMAYELAKAGYWAVDIGHIDIEYEWYLMGATTKVPIPGKYTNESTTGKLVGNLPQKALDKYESEIIAKIY